MFYHVVGRFVVLIIHLLNGMELRVEEVVAIQKMLMDLKVFDLLAAPCLVRQEGAVVLLVHVCHLYEPNSYILTASLHARLLDAGELM